MFVTGNVTFENNKARGGGGISFEIAAELDIADATFVRNRCVKGALFSLIILVFFDIRAVDGGGAIAAMFMKSRDNHIRIRDAMFQGNRARFGGSIQAVFNVHVADSEEPRIEYGGDVVEASIIVSNTTFRNNTAEKEGGAIHFDSVPALMRDIVIRDNNTTESGGGLLLMGRSVIKIVNGHIIHNRASNGGGLMMDTKSMLHCTECDILENTASHYGGGICLSTRPYEPQPVALQCDKCNLSTNSASVGGKISCLERLRLHSVK